jgi:PEP-CTERM motif
VEIDSAGNPTMPDPSNPSTFKQGFNNYHSAKLGLFSEASGEMHEVLFGGISLQFVDTGTMQTVTDDALPFINDITSVVIDPAGNYRQLWLGQFPTLNDLEGKRLRFGANAEFFLADGIETFANGVIKLDELNGPTTLGYIFGGIIANGPHTRSGDPPATSSASNIMFAVVYAPVPEPGTAMLVLIALAGLAVVVAPRACRRRICRLTVSW